MPAAYREMLTAANDELLAQLEANKKKTGYTINQVDTNVNNEELFTSITQQIQRKSIVSRFLGHLVRSMPYGKQDDGPHEGGTER